MSRLVAVALLVATALLVPAVGMQHNPAASAPAPAAARAVPMLAYYYQWFDEPSWQRAKKDYPQLGRYSSDDVVVMAKHVDWAKYAGIDGFIVSWKDSPTNNRRLRLLMEVARQRDFKLSIIYQGLDFYRRPQPVARVAADLAAFRDNFAPDPVFLRLRGKPLTVWSGTWEFSHRDVARVTAAVRSDLLVLSTERSIEGYRRLADVTDGVAYYWSSVNPVITSYYAEKLVDMAEAVHADGKYWMAPFAPGFDARMLGGSRVVLRHDGETLRREYAAAVKSSPDVLGLISWNEFSENTHVEPSVRNGTRYLEVLRELTHTTVALPDHAADSCDGSSASATPGLQPATLWRSGLLLVGFPAALVVGVRALAAVRRRRARLG